MLLAAVYVIGNFVFGALYSLDPAGFSDDPSAGYWDAFFFSVQTMSTIGYGAMHPRSVYVHGLVTSETVFSLLGLAIANGLMFAKFARPRARVMFTRTMVVNRRNGKRCLMLRAANARTTEVVEARLRLAMLRTEVSTEGHRMRKIFDLPLLRDSTPLFTLSWLLIHEIDENSPLHGLDAAAIADDHCLFIVTMSGTDSTLSETVHARHIYTHADVLWGTRFVDVMETLPDGGVRRLWGAVKTPHFNIKIQVAR